MYRGPSRGPCIWTIYPTLLGFGGIQDIILSYSLSYSNCSTLWFFFIYAISIILIWPMLMIPSSWNHVHMHISLGSLSDSSGHQGKPPNSLTFFLEQEILIFSSFASSFLLRIKSALLLNTCHSSFYMYLVHICSYDKISKALNFCTCTYYFFLGNCLFLNFTMGSLIC